MKKYSGFIFAVCLCLGPMSLALADENDPNTGAVEEAVPPQAAPKRLPARSETVQPASAEFLQSRITDLEHQMRTLEEDIKYLDERTRNLDRSVDDLRRHR